MELPQSWRLEGEGRKPTHDFLSLYSRSSLQQEPSPPSQGGYLKTHDFLQVERLGNASAKEEMPVEEAMVEKLPHPPPPPALPPRSVEHILPGGIGTYSISHISYKADGSLFTVAQSSSERNDHETSNCSSYTGSGFTLWEVSAANKGKTGKENTGETEAAEKDRQWAISSLERASQSSTNNHRNSFSSLSFPRPSSKQKSFIEMITSAKGISQYDDFEEDEDFILKKESSTTIHSKGELRVKVGGKNEAGQKVNTPRSKHSATEQRRRSKINDRFQSLRGIIPNSDQKRDKASFLLEVIEYIQFLQEKLNKYEGEYQGWNHEPSKLMPRRNKERPTENHVDESRAVNGVSTPAMIFSVAPNILGTAMNPAESDMKSATPLRPIDLAPDMRNKTMPFLVSPQPNFITSAQGTPSLPADAQTNGAHPIKTLKEQDLAVEGGTISISSVYSQGLLNTLTKALRTSGVDLSHASISVQIELGKQSSSSSTPPTSTLKGRETPSTNQGTTSSRVGFVEGSDRPIKKLKT